MRITSTFLVLIIGLTQVHAGGFQLFLAGSRHLAMGHTGTGHALGASTLFFNPGALVFNPKNSIQVGGAFVVPNTTFLGQFPSIEITKTETKAFSPIHFYASWKKNEDSKLCLGIGVNSPFGHNIKWPDDWTGNLITQEVSITSLFVQPTVSYRITKNLSVGAGVVYGNLNLLMRRALLPFGQPNDRQSSMSLTARGYGWGVNAGLYFEPNETFSFGVSYRSQVKPVFQKVNLDFDVPETFADSFRATSFTSDVTLPGTLSAGIGYRPQETLLLLFDVNYTGWQVYDTFNIDFNENSALLPDIRSAREYKNVFAFRLGGEYNVNENLIVRLGGYYDASPIEEGFVSPELPDADKIGVTGGVGLMNIVSTLSLDLGFQYEGTGERTTFFNEAFMGGTYQSSSFVASLGLNYNF